MELSPTVCPEADRHTSAPFVVERNGKLSLHFHASGVQSQMSLAEPGELMLGYTRTIMKFLVFQDQPRHLAMVGLGGGSLAKRCFHLLPQTRITVAEISPEVIALRPRFQIPGDDERFRVVCQNGAEFVAHHPNTFDVLIIDGFDSKGQPPELCSADFYCRCWEALTPEGLLVVNICDSGRSMLVARLRSAFADRVLIADGEDSTNTVAFASKSAEQLDAKKLGAPSSRLARKVYSLVRKPGTGPMSLAR